VKIRTGHQQNKARMSEKQFSRELPRYGDMVRELAVRGEIRWFDESNVKLAEEIANVISEIRKEKELAMNTIESEYTGKGLDGYVADCIERFGPNSR